jgi:hypothetical protein
MQSAECRVMHVPVSNGLPVLVFFMDGVKAETQCQIVTHFYWKNITKRKLYTVRHLEKER